MLTRKILGCLVVVSLFSFTLAAQEIYQWRSGIVRVNTDVSAGLESFEEVAQLAQNSGLDFVVFSDQFLVDAEYGVFPLRHVLKGFRSRKSIVTYGIEKYLSDIQLANDRFPAIELIPGADIAPHYYWRGTPFSSKFSCNQFSEQLTVIGPDSAKFYAGLPVIHNEKTVFNWMSLIKLLPLLLSLWGILLLFFRNVGGYKDQQGNAYEHKAKKVRTVLGTLMLLTGILWSINNRPFTKPLPFDQYNDFDQLPYQQVIDYIRKNNTPDSCGVFWSAPEANMEDDVLGIDLYTQPYLNDILETSGHNGLAGIYGDAITAHKPGHEWDQLLMEYIQGKRKVKPVIIGELDYHGKNRKIDLIQTVVQVDKCNSSSITKAICRGNSYAYANIHKNKLKINEISLNQAGDNAGLGEVLVYDGNFEPMLKLKGTVAGVNSEKTVLDLTLVCNSEAIYFKQFTSGNFDLNIPLIIPKNSQDKGYVRLLLKSNMAGNIFTNPIFFEKKE